MSQKIVISGSASLKAEMREWFDYWEGKGIKVIAWPIPIADSDFDVEWPKIHQEFYNAIYETDILFVANAGKNGVHGYIGPNAFAEISFAVGLNLVRKRKIKIILQNMPTDGSSYGEALRLWINKGWMEIFYESDDMYSNEAI